MAGVRDEFPVHHAGGARLIAYAWMAVTGLLALSTLSGGFDGSDVATLLILAATVVVAYLAGVRPSVAFDPDALVVRNPLRDSTLPWGQVSDATLRDTVHVTVRDGRIVRCFALPRPTALSSVRDLAGRTRLSGLLRPDPAAQVAAAHDAQGSPDAVAAAINERAARAARPDAAGGAAPPPMQVNRWSPPVLVGLVAAVVLMACGLALLP